MLITETHTKVLIAGAGPSGLMMAAQLLRYGLQPLIIDDKQGPTTQSKALAVQARTLEIYRQMGIVDKVLPNGKPAKGVAFNNDGRQAAKLPITNIGEGQTPYPYVFLFQQYKNEKVLLDYLTLSCCPVYWNTTLVSMNQKTDGADVILKNDSGEYQLICDWVIGADGAHSTVRKQLQIPFEGDTYANYFYLADVKTGQNMLQDDFIQIFLAQNGLAAFFPMVEEGRCRIIGNLPARLGQREDVTLAEILPDLAEITRKNINISEEYWFTTYKLHHRMAAKFSSQRCFLIGDAAHIHSPVGGQGMNTGLQDAYNLAWKLAGVVNGQIKNSILNSYAAERMPVAKQLLKTTDRAFKIGISTNWFVGLFKKWVMPRLLKKIWGNEQVRSAFFKIVSQTGISYRESTINLHLSKGTKIKAGDRLPYLKIHDEKTGAETDLHEWCNKPGFTLLILGKFDEMFLFRIAKWITQGYPGMLNFFYLPPSGKNIEVFNALETLPTQQKAMLIRPDMYIGYINDAVDIGMMDNYLKNVVGFV